MLDAVIQRVASEIIQSEYWRPSSVVLWHAGEPMSVGWEWYQNVHGILDGESGRVRRVQFQSNATLLDRDWISFLRRSKASVGVSIDGPKWLHDRHRKDRGGQGTFDAAMRGVEQLREAQIPFTNIVTVTKDTLEAADAVFDFFDILRPEKLAFSIEEAEGANARSSLYEEAMLARVEAFFQRIAERNFAITNPLRIREIESVIAGLVAPSDRFGSSQETQLGRIIAVSATGDIAVFSPELLTTVRSDGGYETVGNILSDSLTEIFASEAVRGRQTLIDAGVRLCQRSCDIFNQCGGGSPANKVFETERYDVSETWYCRVAKKATVRGIKTAINAALRQHTSQGMALELTWQAPTVMQT